MRAFIQLCAYSQCMINLGESSVEVGDSGEDAIQRSLL